MLADPVFLPMGWRPSAGKQRSALRGFSELLVPQLLDRELELLDQQYPRLGLRVRGRRGRSLGNMQALPELPIV